MLLGLSGFARAQGLPHTVVATAEDSGRGGPAEALAYADELPTFVGGEAALHRYLTQKTVYPADARLHNISGTVVVRFVVDEVGRVVDAEVVRGCGHGLDEEALRLTRLMPWWTPGRMAGRPVRVWRALPISFRLTH
ncbi:MAG: hypothetical protein NVS3B25_02980 [Hymenobacter sp.]